MAPLPLAREYVDGLNREWDRLASAGTWWTGAQRVAIAAVGRAAREGQPRPVVDLPDVVVTAAERLATDPHVDEQWVSSLAAAGLGAEAYVEVLGVVARLSAVDSFMFGIGTGGPQPLPEPRPGEPSRQLVAAAGLDGGLVPTVGRAFAPNSLSAVAAEDAALHDLHGVLYMATAEMSDLQRVRGLDRAQTEFVAARTSLLNDCFF